MLVLPLFLFSIVSLNAKVDKPNIVLVLTDDQDQMLGGSLPAHGSATPIPVARDELQYKGATATNWFIHTPICCPSRAELLSGRYFHNVKEKGQCLKGYGRGDCCMHVQEKLVNNFTLAAHLSKAGYTVGMFGKYLNNCPNSPPPGFDVWFANGGGSYFSPQFATKNLEEFGIPDGHYKGNASVYSTSIIGNISLAWINKVAKGDKPFMAYIGPKACHEPFTPAKWYQDAWDSSWPATEPRPVSWNCSAESRQDHHRVIADETYLTSKGAADVTRIFKDRWRTLISVDDLIRAVLDACDKHGIMDKTYFIYSSDHGFQLGQFGLPFDKRHVYDFDIRIHMVLRGPGIKQNSTFNFLGSNVDVAPTFLGLAGISKPSNMDGKSILPMLMNSTDNDILPATKRHLQSFHPTEYTASWRDSMFIEYYFVDNNTKCIPECHNIEGPSNNFIGIRHVTGEFGNMLYSEFQTNFTSDVFFDAPDFYEMYDLDKDPWEMDNTYNRTSKDIINKLHDKLHMWFNCKGNDCP